MRTEIHYSLIRLKHNSEQSKVYKFLERTACGSHIDRTVKQKLKLQIFL